MEDRHQIAPYPLRMSAELRKRLEDEAQKGNRSLNAEIVQRLEWALELTKKPKVVDSADVQQPVGGALTHLITGEIKQLADRERISFDEMFARIVLAGLHQQAPQVIYLPVFPGVTAEEQLSAAQAAAKVVRPDVRTIVDNLWKARWAPDWMVEVMKDKCPDIIAQVGDQKIMAIETKYTSSDAPAEPPKPRKRIVRPASKKTTEE